MAQSIELWLFSVDIPFIQRAVSAGIDGVVIDWETKGKKQRQAGTDTLISNHTEEDLRQVRRATNAPLICRLNGFSSETIAEAKRAIELGADELLLPMVRAPREVEELLAIAENRVKVGILIETNEAVCCARELAALPLARVFVGLNDLMVENKKRHIFDPLFDGTIETMRAHFHTAFGFGGLTLPECGFPIPSSLLLKEMLRLQCQFTFLRRSFLKDIRERDIAIEIPRMRQWMHQEGKRANEAIEEDKRILQLKINEL